MKNNFSILICLLLLFGCGTKKVVPADTTNCNMEAIVIDVSNLDGCRFLLQVANGEKWLPLKLPNEFKFHNRQKVRFGYQEVKDYVSICMAENKGINITCIEELVSAEAPPIECTEAVQVQKIAWIMQTIKNIRPRQITRYKSKEGYLYYFESNSKGYLYSCKGVLICDVQLTGTGDCMEKIKALKNGKVVWQHM